MNRVPVLLVALAVTLLGACVSPQAQMRTEQDVAEMKRRLAEMEQRTSGVGEEGLGGTMKRLAETRASLDALRVEFQSINGRLADQDMAIRGLREELALVRDDLNLRIEALELRLTEVSARPASPPQPSSEPISLGPEELYTQNLALVREGEDLAAARKGFEEFLRLYPDHTLAVNAAYWIGETYYGEKEYKNAILQFQEIIDKHPQHPKIPAALLKQALAFQALGDKQNARLLLEKVVARYPQSPEASKAKEKLR